MRNDIATLITEYADGTSIETSELEVFCEVKSVNRNEFYAAYAVGLNPRFVVDISPEDYFSGKVGNTFPNKLRIAGDTYLILRSFRKDLIHMELTVA